MRKRLVEADGRAHLFGMALRQGAKTALKLRLSAAENGELSRQGQQLRRDRKQPVEPFLRGEAAYHGKQRHGGRGRETETPLQRALVDGLGSERIGIVAAGYQGVGSRVPQPDIDAVEYAGEAVPARCEQSLQAET